MQRILVKGPCMEDQISISHLKQGDLNGLEALVVAELPEQARPDTLRRLPSPTPAVVNDLPVHALDVVQPEFVLYRLR